MKKILRHGGRFELLRLSLILILLHVLGITKASAQVRQEDTQISATPTPLPIAEARLGLSGLRGVPEDWLGSPARVLTAFGGLPPTFTLPAPSLPRIKPSLPSVPVVPVRPVPAIPRASPNVPVGPGSPQGPGQNPSLPSGLGSFQGPSNSGEGRVQIDDANIPSGILGRKIELGGDVYYHEYEALQIENPLFIQVRSSWEKLDAAWSIRAFLIKRELKDRWEALRSRQVQLMARAKSFDTLWPGLRIEERGEDFKRGWASLTADLALWNAEATDYRARCEGRPGGPSCFSDYRRLLDAWSRLNARDSVLRRDWQRVAEDYNRFFREMKPYFDDVEAWQVDLLDFNGRMQKATIGQSFASAPEPPGWTQEWKPINSPDGKVRWRDPDGNVWTWHPDPGGAHGRGGDHWDVGTPDGRQYWVDPATGEWHEK